MFLSGIMEMREGIKSNEKGKYMGKVKWRLMIYKKIIIIFFEV